jgi:hypothetical protein
MATWKKVIVSGSTANLSALQVDNLTSGSVVIGGGANNLTTTAINGTGTIVATTAATGLSHSGSFSGSFQGSFAGLITSASFATSASYALSASFASTASFVQTAQTASYVLQAVSASFATSASYALSASFAASASRAVSASFAPNLYNTDGTLTGARTLTANGNNFTFSANSVASNVSFNLVSPGTFEISGSNRVQIKGLDNATRANVVGIDPTSGQLAYFTTSSIQNVVSSSFATSASYALSASFVTTASFATSASFALSASFATSASRAVSASRADTAATASYVLQAVSASFATSASYALSASFTSTASFVQTAQTASYVLNAVSASLAQTARTASNITPAITNNTNNYVLTANGDGTINGEANLQFNGTTLTVTGNEVITGNLTVQGTASFQQTTNLEVADRFILLASGSNTTGDGGLVVQQGTQNIGELYGYDAAINRWAFTSSFTANQSVFTPSAYITTTEFGGATPPTSPIYGGASNGYGNIFVSTGSGDIFIYS